MDQNTATIMATSITAISTLLAASLGGFLANHQALKLDKNKIQEEQVKQKKQIIEEIYGNIITVDNKCDMLIHDARQYSGGEAPDFAERIKEIKDSCGRIRILIGLYVPSCKNNLSDYIRVINFFLEAIEDKIASSQEELSYEMKMFYRNDIDEHETEYNRAFEKLQSEIESSLKRVYRI
jgi:hypothetical protein